MFKKLKVCSNCLTIDPAVKGNTKILLNDKPFCEINGNIDDQLNKIVHMVKAFNITDMKIDITSFGMCFYDRLNEILGETKGGNEIDYYSNKICDI